MNKNMSISDIEEFADNYLSSFDGNMSSFEGDESFEGDYYTGDGDDLVDFGGAEKNFMTADVKTFTINLTVTAAITAAWSVALIPGLIYVYGRTSSTVQPVPIVEGSSVGIAAMSAAGSPNSVELFYSFLSRNPMVLRGIRFAASTESVLVNPLIVREQSPFRDSGVESSRVIPMSTNITQDSFNPKIILFETPNTIIGDQTQIIYQFPAWAAAGTCTITFYLSAIANLSQTLAKKNTKALKTFSKVGMISPLGKMAKGVGKLKQLL